MKTRNGFVTNSSSSSFILSSKNDLYRTDSTASFKFDLTAVIDEAIVDQEGLDALFDDMYWENWREDEPEMIEKYNDMLAKINQGYKFYKGWCSNEGEGIELALYDTSFRNVTLPDGVELYEDSY